MLSGISLATGMCLALTILSVKRLMKSILMVVVVLNSLTVFEYGDVKVTRGEAYEDGNVYEIYEDIEPCFACEHDFVNGTVQEHERNTTGGCKVYFYDAVYCILCGYLPEKTLTNIVEYIVCTH